MEETEAADESKSQRSRKRWKRMKGWGIKWAESTVEMAELADPDGTGESEELGKLAALEAMGALGTTVAIGEMED